MKRLLFLLTALLLSACSSNPFKDMYESIMHQIDVKRTPMERQAAPTPSYDQYKKEREQQKEPQKEPQK